MDPFPLNLTHNLVAPQGVTVGATATLTTHDKANGYHPGWRWVSPPGVGDAPQHIYSTYALFPVAIEGPGDEPATYLKITNAPPIIQNFAMRWQGIPVGGGNFLMTGLYTPQAMESPSNDQFAGQ